jgi:hypothetical protein
MPVAVCSACSSYRCLSLPLCSPLSCAAPSPHSKTPASGSKLPLGCNAVQSRQNTELRCVHVEGSCGYGYLYPDQSTGWDIVAVSDSNTDFSGSCGYVSFQCCVCRIHQDFLMIRGTVGVHRPDLLSGEDSLSCSLILVADCKLHGQCQSCHWSQDSALLFAVGWRLSAQEEGWHACV